MCTCWNSIKLSESSFIGAERSKCFENFFFRVLDSGFKRCEIGHVLQVLEEPERLNIDSELSKYVAAGLQKLSVLKSTDSVHRK